MAQVRLTISDEDRDRFVDQAREEGLSFSAWLIAAAHARLAERRGAGGGESTEQIEAFFRRCDLPGQLEAFFRRCDLLEGPEREPDWDEHLATMGESRRGGVGGT